MTLERFYHERFEPEHARMQKPATRDNYETNFRNHYRPHLGSLPLAAIDEDRIMTFRAKLCETQNVVTTNGILGRLAKMLRVAKRMRLTDVVPEVEKLRAGRARPKPVYSDDQIAELCFAAAALRDEHLLVVLLALDAGLRVSEVCALEWGDVDLKGGSVLVQHNTYRGQKQTPKGTIGRIVLTTALRFSRDGSRTHWRRGGGPTWFSVPGSGCGASAAKHSAIVRPSPRTIRRSATSFIQRRS
jgi:integrase